MSEDKPAASDAANKDYEVGFGKPPKRTQFKPGQSGNPRGRPKGTKNLKTDLTEELSERIVVREGEESRKVSKQRAVVKTLVAKTLKGDNRAGALLVSMMMRLLETGEGTPDSEETLLEDEFEVMKAFEDRIRRDQDRRQIQNNEPNNTSKETP
jgi:hypothetical protein